jgi:hypothetical protein
MKTFSIVPKHVREIVEYLAKNHYQDLVEVSTTFDLLFVTTDKIGPALRCRGAAAYAVIRATTAKERTKHLADVEILIDRAQFEKMEKPTQYALLDHELYHLQLKRDKHGEAKLDSQQRPKFKMKVHDREFGWFDEIARRHGEASIEVRQARWIIKETDQLYFGFAEPQVAKKAAAA